MLKCEKSAADESLAARPGWRAFFFFWRRSGLRRSRAVLLADINAWKRSGRERRAFFFFGGRGRATLQLLRQSALDARDKARPSQGGGGVGGGTVRPPRPHRRARTAAGPAAGAEGPRGGGGGPRAPARRARSRAQPALNARQRRGGGGCGPRAARRWQVVGGERLPRGERHVGVHVRDSSRVRGWRRPSARAPARTSARTTSSGRKIQRTNTRAQRPASGRHLA